jgi:hypothetical protein
MWQPLYLPHVHGICLDRNFIDEKERRRRREEKRRSGINRGHKSL